MNAKFEPEVERNVILTMTETEARHLAYILFQVGALEAGFSSFEYSAVTIKNVLAHAAKVAFVIHSLIPERDLGEGIRV